MVGDKVPLEVTIVRLPSLADMGRPGVYFLYRNGAVVYVGQGVNVRKRIADHIGEGLKSFDAVSFFPCPKESLDRLERRYIRALLPEYNRCHFSNLLRQSGEVRPQPSVAQVAVCAGARRLPKRLRQQAIQSALSA